MSKWLETNEAAALLSLKPRQLRKLRQQMKKGKHFICKNPRATRHEYLWNVTAIEKLMEPVGLLEVAQPGDRSEPSGDRVLPDVGQP